MAAAGLLFFRYGSPGQRPGLHMPLVC